MSVCFSFFKFANKVAFYCKNGNVANMQRCFFHDTTNKVGSLCTGSHTNVCSSGIRGWVYRYCKYVNVAIM